MSWFKKITNTIFGKKEEHEKKETEKVSQSNISTEQKNEEKHKENIDNNDLKETEIKIEETKETKQEILDTTTKEENYEIKQEIIENNLTQELEKEKINISEENILEENILEEKNIETSIENEEKENQEEQNQEEVKEEKKSWFSKVVDTLNSPIEIKIETKDGDDSWLGKLKGNISIGLGEPIKRETSEEREKWKETLKERLSRTRQAFIDKLDRLLHGRTKIDEDLLEEIEEILLESDVGVEMTEKITSNLRKMAKDKRFLPSEVMPSLFDFLKEQLELEESRIIIDDSKLNIIMMVGVNGTGKTTTTGKIAAKLKISNYSVMMAAADTFRAAAIDQLDVWSKRAEVPLIKHQENSDAAAVVFDAIKAAKARNMNVLLIDTAGRLHNKVNLMEELRKIRRIIDKEAPDAKLEVLLVLDGTTGQNGLKQATVFAEAVKLTGVVLTKLDGTAKGGVIFSIRDSLNIPIKLVGVGEGIEDLRDFEPQIFIDALLSKKTENLIQETTKKVEN